MTSKMKTMMNSVRLSVTIETIKSSGECLLVIHQAGFLTGFCEMELLLNGARWNRFQALSP